MRWNIHDDSNFFLKIEKKLGFHRVVLTKSRMSPRKFRLTLINLQQFPGKKFQESKFVVLIGRDTTVGGSLYTARQIQTN